MSNEKTPAPRPTISMHWIRLEDGSYGVQLLVTGLSSQAQAEAAMDHMQQLMCGQQIQPAA